MAHGRIARVSSGRLNTTAQRPSARPRDRFGLPPMLAAIAVTTAGQLPVFLTGALAVQIGRDVHLPASGLGFAVAAFFGCSALCNAWFGKLTDRIGGVTVMRYGLVPAVVALLLIGLGIRNWQGLIGALVIAGVANGTVQPAANRYLTRVVASGRQGLAFGVKQAAIPAATLLGGVSVPVVGHTVGWRWAFIGAAALTVCVGLLIRRPAGVARAAASRATAAAPERAAFARRPLVVVALGVGLGSAAANAMGAYFVLSAGTINISDSTAGLIAAAGSAVSLLVRLAVGLRADRRTTGHLELVAGLCAFGAVGPLLLATGQPGLLLVAAVIGYGAGWGWAGLVNFAVASSHRAAPARATGLTGAGASTGACVGPLVFGLLADHVGYRPAWILVTALMLAAGTVIALGRHALHTTTAAGAH